MTQEVTTRTSVSPVPNNAPARKRLLRPLQPKDLTRRSTLLINCALAFEAIWSNRLRSLLTALGIFIGVAAVIAALTLTQGVSANINNQLSSLGTNVITISNGSGSSNRGPFSTTTNTLSLTPQDITAVTKVTHVTAISGIISSAEQTVYTNQNWNTRIQGVGTDFVTIQNWQIAEGAWFTAADDQGAHTVVVLGQTVAQNLFSASGDDPIGKTVRIRDQLYKVIGVLQAKGGGGSADDVVFTPLNTALDRIKNTSYVDSIQAQVDDSANIDQVQQDMTAILQRRHHIIASAPNDFNLSNSNQLLQTANQFTSLLTILLVGIASISLTVGGVGIMNIMIVSVTERTREIGIRMSLGAARADIRNQFLIEALALSLVGGIIGMIIGFSIGYAVTNLVGIPFVVTTTALILPFGISSLIGVVFGLYPAVRASRLDPIDALRSI